MSKVPNCIIRSHARMAIRTGLNVESLLSNNRLSPTAVLAGEGVSDMDDFALFLSELWLALGDEAGGFLANSLKPGTFAMMNHACISAGNLHRALNRSAQFIQLLTDDLHIQLTVYGKEAHLRFHIVSPCEEDRRVYFDTLLVLWLRWSSWLIDQVILPERVHLNFPLPPYHSEYPAMYSCPVYAEQTQCLLVFDQAYLARPITRQPEDLRDFLSRAPANILVQYRTDQSLGRQILKRLEETDDAAEREQAAVAQFLALSPATLRRKLHKEGTNFQALKDQWRRRRAITLLKSTELPLQHIAEQLGFTEASAFHRAFKKWTGDNPGSFRNE